ncbi:MAG: AAA family ATPase [Thermoanaerobaculia bacterium]
MPTLKLKRLELSGFKSFVDPVTLQFAGGITAIVGPNGCGKSNISDAITWVLGEQSAKNLRGDTMEDVIFGGSSERKPLGMAEVQLVLETDPSFAASEEGVLTIGRRVFRSGESQYRMNGRVVRLKEIKDVLMDTGLGIRAYSVIEQGKIGMILSGKPQERRKLIEEAAGITRYKARKRIAEVKLEEARANLLRLDDVIGEVERALRSLKRQANAARRYKQKQQEHRELLERVLTLRWARLRERLDELRSALETALSRDAELAADLHGREAAVAEGREAADRLAERVAALHQEAADLGARIEGRQQLVKSGRERLQEIAERIAAGRTLAESRERESETLAERLTEVTGHRDELARELERAADEVSRDEEQTRAADRELRETETRRESVREELLEAAAGLNRLRQQLHQGEIELEKANYRSHHLDQEIEEHGQELRAASEALETAGERVATLEAAIEERSAVVARLGEELDAVVREEAAASEAVRKLEGELSEARQRKRLLEELSRAHAERRTVLEEALAGAGHPEPVYLADRVEALEGWERALDHYLGELADAVVLPEGAEPLQVAEALSGQTAARLVAPRPGGSGGPDGPEEAAPSGEEGRSGEAGPSGDAESPDDAGQAAGAPEVDDPAVVLPLGNALGLEAPLAAALPPAWLVGSAADAERLARRHPGAAFLAPDGLWVQGGVVHLEGPRAEPGVLERERHLADLVDEVPRLEGRLEDAERTLEETVERRSGKAREKNAEESEVARLHQEVAVARARREDAAARHRRLDKEAATLDQERRALGDEVGSVRERHATLEAEIQAADERHGSLQERFDRTEEEVRQAKERREGLRESSAGRRGRLDLLKERLDSNEREMERLRREIEEDRRQAEGWRQEGERLARRRRELEDEIATAETELQSALERRSSVQEELTAEQERLDERRRALKEIEGELAGLRRDRESVRETIEGLRIQEAELKQDAGHLAESYWEEFRRELPEPASRRSEATGGAPGGAPAARDEAEAAGPGDGLQAGEPPEEAEDLEELEAELSRTKATLERLGPVNVLAVEEYEEQQERHGFLTEQRADVEQSVESLKRTIREINQTSSERFRETFAQVNRAFGETFTQLFRGGEAEMRLQDEEDLLESGIEIVARPPGKRLQNLMLLSGGEKALTAIALLFALFRTKPSPFCILDEVDAPLDDPNTVRFVELLHEMAQDTQFLVITHNKITMEQAATLYGVTMEERGVSKLVAVELDEIHPGDTRAATA